MKLSFKLIIVPILLGISVFASIVLYTVSSISQSTLNALEGNQSTLITNMAQSVDDYMNKYRDAIVQLETLEPVKDVSNHGDIHTDRRGLSYDEAPELRYLFQQTLEIYPQFAYLETFTKDKAMNVVLEPYPAQLNISEEDFLRGFAYRDWYKGAMENNGVYVSEAYISASTFEPVVAISTPIFNEVDPVGIMIGTLRLNELSQRASQYSYGETGIMYIVDKNSNIVAHPNMDFINVDTLINLESSSLMTHINENNGSSKGTMKVYDSFSGEEVYVAFTKVSSTDWVVVTQISAKELEAPVRNVISGVASLSILLIVIYLVFLFFNTNDVVQALSFLNRISVHVADNDLNLTEEEYLEFMRHETSTNEIGLLMNSYHTMLKRLNDSFSVLEQRNEKIDFLAHHDPLTELANRRQFRTVLSESLVSEKTGAVILMDLDNFKQINDTLGHMVGDKVLAIIAEHLGPMSDDHFFVARFGGDEFIICLRDVDSDELILDYVRRIREIFSHRIIVDELNLDLRFSIGIAKYPEHSNNMYQLIRYADLALYEAKKSGKNRYEFFLQELEDVVFRKTDIEHSLDHALDSQGFSLVYQPQVALDSGDIVGYEALIRMNNNLYNPGEFIPVAEETGQIFAIGRWVLEEAIHQQRQWLDEGYDIKPVAVNFSAAQLQDKEFVDFFIDTLQTYDLEASFIEIEITESVFVEKFAVALEFLDRVSAMGVKTSIDDFGTGYSSLNYLLSLPISKIKLDRSLSAKYLTPDSIETIRSIIQLSHSLDLTVVAEGIETHGDVRCLVQSECDVVQGYYFDRPLAKEAVRETFERNYIEVIEEKEAAYE